MAMALATLETELKLTAPNLNALTACTELAQAYGNYVHDAEANGVPAIPAFIDSTCVPAMAASLATIGVPGTPATGAASFKAALVAFWAAAVAAPASFMAGATAITPPSFFPFNPAGPFEATLLANVGKSFDDAMDAIAADMDTGTASFPAAAFGAGFFVIT